MRAKGSAELDLHTPQPPHTGTARQPGQLTQSSTSLKAYHRLPLPASRFVQDVCVVTLSHTHTQWGNAHSHTTAQYSYTSDLVVAGRRHPLG